jgi:hypothetical protein
MNDEIQPAGKLLAELREAYRGLSQHNQGHVKCLLCEPSPQKQPGDERAE